MYSRQNIINNTNINGRTQKHDSWSCGKAQGKININILRNWNYVSMITFEISILITITWATNTIKLCCEKSKSWKTSRWHLIDTRPRDEDSCTTKRSSCLSHLLIFIDNTLVTMITWIFSSIPYYYMIANLVQGFTVLSLTSFTIHKAANLNSGSIKKQLLMHT